jgi:simple sugar transport system permease protein
MASANLSGAPANLPGDERVRNVGSVRKLLARPEFGAIAGTLLVVAIFVLAAGDSGMFSAEGTVNWGTVAGFLGIIAVGAALLMIAGEFDLSVGSMIGFAGMMVAIPILEWGWAPSAAVVFAFACAMALG